MASTRMYVCIYVMKCSQKGRVEYVNTKVALVRRVIYIDFGFVFVKYIIYYYLYSLLVCM